MDRKNINRGRQLMFVREYRGYTQKDLCLNIKGLSKKNLSRFEKGFDSLTDDLIKDIMNFLDWPVSWIDKEPIKIEFLCQ